ncbi:unnamed protein product [Closterium sp. Naga37s-1]|nr:unnamed protein product [Closterium sp. Naga37s-1]
MRIHLGAKHLMPSTTGHGWCKEVGSGELSGCMLKKSSASPLMGFTEALGTVRPGVIPSWKHHLPSTNSHTYFSPTDLCSHTYFSPTDLCSHTYFSPTDLCSHTYFSPTDLCSHTYFSHTELNCLAGTYASLQRDEVREVGMVQPVTSSLASLIALPFCSSVPHCRCFSLPPFPVSLLSRRSAASPAHPESRLAAIVEVALLADHYSCTCNFPLEVITSPLFLCKHLCCFSSPPSSPLPSSAKACISPHSHFLPSIIPPATPPITPQLFQRITGGMI